MKTDTNWHLISQIEAAVLILDINGNVQHASQEVLRVFGLESEKQIRGENLSSFLSDDGNDHLNHFIQSQSTDNSISLVDTISLENGTRREISLTAKQLPDSAGFNPGSIWTVKEMPTKKQTGSSFDQKQKMEDLQWLADQGRELLSITHWPDILDIAGQALQEKLGDCIVVTLTRPDEDHLVMEGFYGIENKLASKVLDLIGIDNTGVLLPIDEQYKNTYSTRKLYCHTTSFEDFASSFIHPKISRQIKRIVGIKDIYTIGLEGNQRVMGCFYIYSLGPDFMEQTDLIESFTFQVALALEKTKFAEDLKSSEKQFQTIFEYAPDGYYISDLQGNFLNGNLAAEKIIGYERSEIIGKNFLSIGLITKDQILKAGKLLAQNLLGKSTGPDEFVLTRKDGNQINVEISTHPVKLEDKSVVLGIARDISDRKKDQETLTRSHDSLTRVLEGIDAHVYVADLNTYEILYMNKKMIEDFGGNFNGKPCYEVFRGEKKACSFCTNPSLVTEKGEPGEVIEWESHNKKTDRWHRNYDRAIYWTDQQLARMQIAVDITDSKGASIALEQSEERYRYLFESAHDAVMTLAPPDWLYTSGNPALVDMFGLDSEGQFLTYKPWDLSPNVQPDGRKSQEKAREMIDIAVDQGAHFFRWTHKRVNGEEFPATVQLTRVDHHERYFLQATVKDITDQVISDDRITQQMQDLALLNNLNVAANQGTDLNEILAQVSRDTERLFLSRSTTVYLLSEDGDHLHVKLQNLNTSLLTQIEKLLGLSLPEHLEIPIREDSIFRKLLDTGEVIILSKKEEIFDLVNEYMASTFLSERIKRGLKKLMPKIYQIIGIKSVIIAPLISKGKPFGLIDMSSSQVYSEDEKNRFVSIAEQLSGFIQKINAEKERVDKLNELELIYNTFVEGSRLENVDEICKHLVAKIHEVNPDCYVMVTLYDPEMKAIRVKALAGLGNKAEKLFKILGTNPIDFVVKIDDSKIDQKFNEIFTNGKLELVPNGMYDLSRRTIPQAVCKSAEKFLGVEEIYIAGFGLEKNPAGGLVLFVKEGNKINYSAAIETIANHFAIIFARRQAQSEIVKRQTQLEALREVELEITSELDIETLLQSIAEKATAIINASASGFSIYNPERNVLEYTAFTGFQDLPENTDVYPGEGLSGKVWESKETLIVENYMNWEGGLENWAPLSNYYMVGIPVCWGVEMLGVLEIALDPDENLSPNDISILELFATQAAIALKNARLFSDEKLRRIEAETLREVGMMINKVIDEPELLERILTSLQKVVPYNSASIQLVNGSDIIVEAFRGNNARKDVIGTAYQINDNLVAKRILYGGETIILNSKEKVRDLLEGSGSQDVSSWLALPLESKGNRIGILTIDHKLPDKYSKQDADLVSAFSAQAVVALENSRLFTAIRRRTTEIEAVYDSALNLTKELEPDILFENLYDQIKTLFNPDAFILGTYDTSMQMIRIEYATEADVRQHQVEGNLISSEEQNSLLSWMVRKKSHLLIGNVETDSLPVQPQQKGRVLRSWLGVPLLIGKRVCGVLVVQSYDASAYSHEDQRLLQLLGNQVAIALENSRLFDEARRRLSRLTSLHDIDQAISGSIDLEMTMDVLVGHLIHTLEVDAACVLAYNQGTQTLEYVDAKGFRTNSLQYTSLKIGSGLAGQAALERNLVHIPDLNSQETGFQRSPQFVQEEFVSYMAQPLIAKGELVGVLEVFHRQTLTPNPEWFHFLDSLSRSAAIAIDRLNLFNDLAKSNVDLIRAYDATIEGWARAIELRDGDTEDHSRRVEALTLNLARTMGVYKDDLLHMRRGALLHDIGKIAIPDGILLKTGKLTEEEWLIMKKHPTLAYDMLSKIDYLKPALDIPLNHHERWDGSGYPQGLAGEDIPIQARIFAVVDVWDALQSDRPYREAWSEKKTIQYLKDQAGKEFDPGVVSKFLDLIGKS